MHSGIQQLFETAVVWRLDERALHAVGDCEFFKTIQQYGLTRSAQTQQQQRFGQRSGQYQPSELPPVPAVDTVSMQRLLADAYQALGRLDGVASALEESSWLWRLSDVKPGPRQEDFKV